MTSSLDPATRHGALISLGRTCKAVKEHSEQPVDQRISAETLEVCTLRFSGEFVRGERLSKRALVHIRKIAPPVSFRSFD